ncbi:MAG: hypothetical protein QGG42_12300 [Phycisphaerae bacterium]|jgi:hypothetical protein|nr:hypothetical protein [Phycisphaerae bacterium]
MNMYVMTAVVGIMIAVGGVELNGGKGRMLALGLAICVAALTCGLRVLQKQIDEVKFASGNLAADDDVNPKD